MSLKNKNNDVEVNIIFIIVENVIMFGFIFGVLKRMKVFLLFICNKYNISLCFK